MRGADDVLSSLCGRKRCDATPVDLVFQDGERAQVGRTLSGCDGEIENRFAQIASIKECIEQGTDGSALVVAMRCDEVGMEMAG
ncbi:hypothetical protein VTL71DRAFT_6052 [Oculimacula yallundae]|uniref:Uncharacterized protein n=1 Tax=Oculimacula yallundae TaxID=86028 RepID=A0ABR4BZ99_9HELO